VLSYCLTNALRPRSNFSNKQTGCFIQCPEAGRKDLLKTAVLKRTTLLQDIPCSFDVVEGQTSSFQTAGPVRQPVAWLANSA